MLLCMARRAGCPGFAMGQAGPSSGVMGWNWPGGLFVFLLLSWDRGGWRGCLRLVMELSAEEIATSGAHALPGGCFC